MLAFLADLTVLKIIALCALGAGATVAAILVAYLWAEQKIEARRRRGYQRTHRRPF